MSREIPNDDARRAGQTLSDAPRVALVALPWYSVWVPSVQLCVLRQCLDGVADVDSYELYVDYAATISTRLYDPLSGGGEFVEEWLFAHHYFEAEGHPPAASIAELSFPPCHLGEPEREVAILTALAEVTGDFLYKMRDAYDWGRYDVIGFTLGIAQTGASMALARLIKLKHPEVRIVFGGSACMGPSGEAILRMCPYVDVVVRGEAEVVVAELVRRLYSDGPLDDLSGVSYRLTDGGIKSTPTSAGLYSFQRTLAPPNFDEYLARMERCGLFDKYKIMLPFESSRGCWWGEKNQCTFCGLAETMRYRKRDADDVLAEIDSLYERYGIGQFFATDLIMPQEFYRTFLPRIKESERNYYFYYELKGNVKREQMALLAGLVHVQPGLESLNTNVLALMNKGISAAQNVQFLKWCREYNVQIFSWHLIAGMPGEIPADNERMASAMPGLWHLQPPLFAIFELHRFSPIHSQPHHYGLSKVRPAKAYSNVFPVAQEILDDLVYRFDYDSEQFGGPPPWLLTDSEDYAASMRAAVEEWRAAHERGAALTIELRPEGGAVIVDTRYSESATVYSLPPPEAELYEHLDTARQMSSALAFLRNSCPDTWRSLGGDTGALRLVDSWVERRLVFQESGRVVALATHVAAPPAGLPAYVLDREELVQIER